VILNGLDIPSGFSILNPFSEPLHNVLHIFLPKRFSIPHNVLMQPKSFSNLRGAELFQNQNSLGRFMVRRTTIRKRMRAKLRQIKPELRKRMHDPVPQTGQWLRSVVQGYFNYYAVPGNNASLSLFRHRVLVCWWHSIRRRTQKHRINWTRMLTLAKRWLPRPAVLHPFPDARFAATHPR